MRRVIQVGVGGYGRTWLDTLERFRDRVTHAALVDASEDALAIARRRFDVPIERCYPTLDRALDEVEADTLLCVVPPAHHEAAIVPALERGLHVLSEKP